MTRQEMNDEIERLGQERTCMVWRLAGVARSLARDIMADSAAREHYSSAQLVLDYNKKLDANFKACDELRKLRDAPQVEGAKP